MTVINHQRGAVLIVSLIFLLLITFIALTTMSSSTFQTTMATNMQQRASVFRVAESAAEQSLAEASWSGANNAHLIWEGNGRSVAAQRIYTTPSASLVSPEYNVSMSATVVYLGDGALPEDFSFDSQGPKLKNFIYEARGAATTDDGKIATRVIQGVSKLTMTGSAANTYDP